MLAIGGLGLVIAIVALLLLTRKSGAEYHLLFSDSGSLVRGDEVQVGGVPVGTIKNITLNREYKALVTIQVEGALVPLHEGTTAQIRVPSLASIANRYIALSPGPNNLPALKNGATLQGAALQSTVDLDQLFNIFDKRTRESLQKFVIGSSEQYAGASRALSAATLYFPPSLAAATHTFNELAGDQRLFESFLVESAKALTILGEHREHLSGIVQNASATFQSVANEQSNITAGLKQLPRVFEEGNRTLAELPSTLHALRQLVDAAKPSAPRLAPFFAQLQSLLHPAEPVLANLTTAFSKPGPANDLTDAASQLPEVAHILSTASPALVKSLREAVPFTTPFGPYAPDFMGLFRNFGVGAGYYDANGHYTRVAPNFAVFKPGANGSLQPVTPAQGLEGIKRGQLRRCPGGATAPAADGSSPFTDNGQLSCDPSQVP
ncbi:MAG: MlaD family protein [Solirubrobacterales bacterium]|nr:MlaD family protein [Solirubrobacterales bacterium]